MRYKNLEVWKRSIDLVENIYQVTDLFPKSEIWGLTQQLRRASISIPSNIAEGSNRFSHKDFIRFLRIAKGSSAEIETQIFIAQKLGYLSQQKQNSLVFLLTDINKMIYGLIRSLKKPKTNN